MAHFRQCFPSNLNITTIKEVVHALASHHSYEVPVSSIFIVRLVQYVDCIDAVLFLKFIFQHIPL